MKIQRFNDPKQTPYLYLTEIFSDAQLDLMAKEIQQLVPRMKEPSETGTAGVVTNPRKKNMGIWLNSAYQREDQSPALIALRAVYGHLYASRAWQNHALDLIWKGCNQQGILLSTYGEGDEYKTHCDMSVFTGLFWLRNEPHDFDGGDFTLSDYGITIPCLNNTGVIFLGGEYHEVSPVVPHDENFGGRHVFSVFSTLSPTPLG